MTQAIWLLQSVPVCEPPYGEMKGQALGDSKLGEQGKCFFVFFQSTTSCTSSNIHSKFIYYFNFGLRVQIYFAVLQGLSQVHL